MKMITKLAFLAVLGIATNVSAMDTDVSIGHEALVENKEKKAICAAALDKLIIHRDVNTSKAYAITLKDSSRDIYYSTIGVEVAILQEDTVLLDKAYILMVAISEDGDVEYFDKGGLIDLVSEESIVSFKSLNEILNVECDAEDIASFVRQEDLNPFNTDTVDEEIGQDESTHNSTKPAIEEKESPTLQTITEELKEDDVDNGDELAELPLPTQTNPQPLIKLEDQPAAVERKETQAVKPDTGRPEETRPQDKLQTQNPKVTGPKVKSVRSRKVLKRQHWFSVKNGLVGAGVLGATYIVAKLIMNQSHSKKKQDK